MIRLAHRGYSALYPENTMLSFKKAIEKGFDGIETDVHLTKDNYLVLCHDETIDRTSNGKGYIKDLTLKELRQFNFSNNQDVTCDIPLLSDLLSLIRNKDILLNIEIKTDHIHYPDIEEKVIALVKEYHVEDQVIYSSFYLPSLLKLRELNHQVYVGYLFSKNAESKIDEAMKHHLSAIHPKYCLLNDELIQKAKEHNLKIAVWTPKDIKEYDYLLKNNVDYSISNDYFGETHETR